MLCPLHNQKIDTPLWCHQLSMQRVCELGYEAYLQTLYLLMSKYLQKTFTPEVQDSIPQVLYRCNTFHVVGSANVENELMHALSEPLLCQASVCCASKLDSDS